MHRRYIHALPLVLSLASLSCSDPVPASAAVGLTLNVQPSASCPYNSSILDDIGNPPPNSLQPTGAGKRVYSGESGLEANCSITGGSPFVISGGATMNSPRVSFNLEGSMSATGQGTATMAFFSPSIGETVQSDPNGCRLTAIPTSDGIQIRPGAMWAKFQCDSLKTPPNMNCGAYGEIILENCKK